MAADGRELERDMSIERANISQSNEGTEFPFPHFPSPKSNKQTPDNSASTSNPDAEAQHTKRRSKSQSRSSSISSLLLVTTERLGQETNRANLLDARCAEVLARLRTVVEERDQLRRTLNKVQEELGLYKFQLEAAQNEIFRAQKIVDDVDRARVEAEEQAAKDRTIARKLASEHAVWVAREEGRNEGFKEGLREGQRAFEAALERSRAEERTNSSREESSRPRERSTRRSSSSTRKQSTSSSSKSADAPSYAPTLPMHAIPARAVTDAPSSSSQPVRPSRPKSAQPQASRPAVVQQPPPQQATQRPDRPPSPRATRPLPQALLHSAETIDIQPEHPELRPPSPLTISRRSVVLPPDGIPTIGADSVIALPPPHELSRPASVAAESMYTLAQDREGGGVNAQGGGRRRTMSNVSAVSTRYSQFDILGPPRAAASDTMSHSSQVAREWRIANPDPAERSQKSSEDSQKSDNFSTRSSATRSQASQRVPGPRRPREIVMPMPLSSVMQGSGIYAPPNKSAPNPPPLHDPYSSPSAGPSFAPVAMPPPPASLLMVPDHTDDTNPNRPRSAGPVNWLKSRFNRTVSASSVPNIQIEPPSDPASTASTGITVNNVLLTPEDAGHATLPQQFIPELAGALAGVQLAPVPALLADGAVPPATTNVIVLPDNELPRGFVPLSPIMPTLHSVSAQMTPIPSGPRKSTPAPPANPPNASHAPAPAPSPQPPAYTPRDLYARALPRPATAGGTRSRSPPQFEVVNSVGRARGATIGSAMLGSPAPLNRPISLFSES